MLQIVENFIKNKTKIKIFYKIKKLDKNFRNFLKNLKKFYCKTLS